VLLSFWFQDGSWSYGHELDTSVINNEWELIFGIFDFDMLIKTIHFSLRLRLPHQYPSASTVWFHAPAIFPIGGSLLCKVRNILNDFHQMPLAAVHIGLEQNENSEQPLNNKLLFFVIWNEPKENFLLKHRRSIESIFFQNLKNQKQDPISVLVYSNTLSLRHFFNFQASGYPIRVVRYQLKPPSSLALNDSLSLEKQYLSFWLLFQHGGVYLDLEHILVRPLLSPLRVEGKGGKPPMLNNFISVKPILQNLTQNDSDHHKQLTSFDAGFMGIGHPNDPIIKSLFSEMKLLFTPQKLLSELVQQQRLSFHKVSSFEVTDPDDEVWSHWHFIQKTFPPHTVHIPDRNQHPRKVARNTFLNFALNDFRVSMQD